MNPSLDTAAGRRPPTLLLVEDDPVSQCFLQEALAAMPAQVQVATTAAEALRLAMEVPPSLCLIDAHLPDASGLDLLQSLRTRGLRAPALAHTAESAPTLHDALRAGGFLAVLRKPLSVAALHRAVREALDDGDAPAAPASAQDDAPACTVPLAALPAWDDTAALRALNGNAAIVDGMRTLFRGELTQTLPRIAALREHGEVDALRGELHKLKAATAFVGAARLAAAVAVLAECHAQGHADDHAYAEVVAAAEALLRAG